MNNKRFYFTVLVIALIISTITVSYTAKNNTSNYEDFKTQEDFNEIIVEVTLVFDEDFDHVVDFNGIDYNDLDEQIHEYITTGVRYKLFVEPIAVIIKELQVPDYDKSIIGEPLYPMVNGKL